MHVGLLCARGRQSSGNTQSGHGKYGLKKRTTLEKRGQEPGVDVSNNLCVLIFPVVCWPPLEKLLVPCRILSYLEVEIKTGAYLTLPSDPWGPVSPSFIYPCSLPLHGLTLKNNKRDTWVAQSVMCPALA